MPGGSGDDDAERVVRDAMRARRVQAEAGCLLEPGLLAALAWARGPPGRARMRAEVAG